MKNRGVFLFATITGLLITAGGLSFWFYGPILKMGSDYIPIEVEVDSLSLGTQKRGVNPSKAEPYFFKQEFKLAVHFQDSAANRIATTVEIDSIVYFQDSLTASAADSALRNSFQKGQQLRVFSKKQTPEKLRQKRPEIIVDPDRTPLRTRFGRMMLIAGLLILGMGSWGMWQAYQANKD